jgi:hypothetical protein
MKMKIPPELVALLLSALMTAQARGLIDPRSLVPLLQTIVDRGYGYNVRQFLGEILQLLEQIEKSTVRPTS